jgi:putative ABC transport system ATP-binding protein
VLAARCEEVERRYRTGSGEVRALRGVTARFESGVITAVVGPSGSGKSSLLRLLAGVDRPTSGTVWVGGIRVDRASARARRRLRRQVVGYIFQRSSDNFFPHLTIREHLDLVSRGRMPERALELVRSLGIEGRLDHLPSELSGGEQQRAAFAVAASSGASLLVADEPTAQLDDRSSEDLMRYVRALPEEGVTVIVATHDPLVRSAAGAVVELDHGTLSADRTRAPFARPPRVAPATDAVPRVLRDAGRPLLRVEGLGKSFHRAGELIHAVDGAELTLSSSEFVALTGRSGAGKSTLLHLLAGWEEPDAGRIRWMTGAPEAIRTWSEMAILPQQLGLLDELTVRENVEFPVRLGTGLHVPGSAVQEVLEGLGLESLAARYPPEISVGEQQRTALARALVLSPSILIADEPSGHQDAGWAAVVFGALRDASAEGSGCLVATHDRSVRRFADRELVMHDGRLAAAGG